MTRLLTQYREQVVPNLKKELGQENVHALPKVEKVIINMGVTFGLGINEGTRNPVRRTQIAL